MIFEQWWEEHKLFSSRPDIVFSLDCKAIAKSAWDAAKQSVVDELNLSIVEAWPDEEQLNDA